MTSPWIGVIGVVVVGAVAMMLRRARGGADEEVTMPPAEPEPDEAPSPATAGTAAATAEEEDETDAEHLALSSDGHAFAPQGRGVVIAPQRHFQGSRQPGDDGSRVLPAAGESDMQPPVVLSPGDLIAARVVRGSPGLDPWRLETLGRDRDLVVWPFETRDAAEAAHALLERRVVRPARDEFGDPVVVGDEDFEAAQAELERTLNELSADIPDDDEPAGDPHR